MNLSGEITVRAPRQAVFDAVRDARFFAACIEGVRDLVETDATHYTARFETRLAYMSFRFDVAVELTRVEPPARIEAKLEGTPIGVVGRLSARSDTTLAEVGGETTIRYAIELALTGKLGAIGRPVLTAKAKEMERQFTERLRAAFAPSSQPPAVRAAG
jgi:carbon monoxide dehydrogenase subunit G